MTENEKGVLDLWKGVLEVTVKHMRKQELFSITEYIHLYL